MTVETNEQKQEQEQSQEAVISKPNDDIARFKSENEALRKELEAFKTQQSQPKEPVFTEERHLKTIEAEKKREDEIANIEKQADLNRTFKAEIKELAEKIGGVATDMFKQYEANNYSKGYGLKEVNKNALSDIMEVAFKDVDNVKFIPKIYQNKVKEFMLLPEKEKPKHVEKLLPALHTTIENKEREDILQAKASGHKPLQESSSFRKMLEARNNKVKGNK